MNPERQRLEDDILRLYREPIIGANYTNTYGEENLVNLVSKYRALSEEDMEFMRDLLSGFSQSPDLASSYVSVGVLHALGLNEQVEAAYAWAETQDNCKQITSHFDIGVSLANHFSVG